MTGPQFTDEQLAAIEGILRERVGALSAAQIEPVPIEQRLAVIDGRLQDLQADVRRLLEALASR